MSRDRRTLFFAALVSAVALQSAGAQVSDDPELKLRGRRLQHRDVGHASNLEIEGLSPDQVFERLSLGVEYGPREIAGESLARRRREIYEGGSSHRLPEVAAASISAGRTIPEAPPPHTWVAEAIGGGVVILLSLVSVWFMRRRALQG